FKLNLYTYAINLLYELFSMDYEFYQTKADEDKKEAEEHRIKSEQYQTKATDYIITFLGLLDEAIFNPLNPSTKLDPLKAIEYLNNTDNKILKSLYGHDDIVKNKYYLMAFAYQNINTGNHHIDNIDNMIKCCTIAQCIADQT